MGEYHWAVGDPVHIVANDYDYVGRISAIFAKLRSGAPRYVVEDDRGRLFIHGEHQMVSIEEMPALTLADRAECIRVLRPMQSIATTALGFGNIDHRTTFALSLPSGAVRTSTRVTKRELEALVNLSDRLQANL